MQLDTPMFYQAVMANAISFAVVTWDTGIKVVSSQLVTFEEVVEQRIPTKLPEIMDNTSHPLYKTINNLRSNYNCLIL